jgi:hypothetical protein
MIHSGRNSSKFLSQNYECGATMNAVTYLLMIDNSFIALHNNVDGRSLFCVAMQVVDYLFP